MEGIGDLARLEHWQCQQLIGWRGGEGCVLRGGEGSKPVAGLRGDDDSGPARRDDVPELFQDHCCPVQVDSEDGLGRGLAGRDARGMDHASDVAERGGGPGECLHGRTGGDIDSCRAHVKASVSQHPGRRIGVALMEIGEQDVLACTDAAGNCLADLASADDDDDIAHEVLLTEQP